MPCKYDMIPSMCPHLWVEINTEKEKEKEFDCDS
jgi:hypothetical protein